MVYEFEITKFSSVFFISIFFPFIFIYFYGYATVLLWWYIKYVDFVVVVMDTIRCIDRTDNYAYVYICTAHNTIDVLSFEGYDRDYV
jgi:hypothetical protein